MKFILLLATQFLLNFLTLTQGHKEKEDSRKVTKYKQLCPRITDHWKHPDESFHSDFELRSSAADKPDLNHNVKKDQSKLNKNSSIRPSLFPNVPPYYKFVLHNETIEKWPEEIQKSLTWRISNTRGSLVINTAKSSGFTLVDQDSEWNYLWDKFMKSKSYYLSVKPHQKMNQSPGSKNLDHKGLLWINLHQAMLKFGKKKFDFVPETFILPYDFKALEEEWAQKCQENCLWFVKPPQRANGEGVHVISEWSQVPTEKKVSIVQEYIKPLLIDGRKFDMRIYVLVTSYRPLRVYLYNNGFVRLAVMKYSDSTDTVNQRMIHLTNHAISRKSKYYIRNQDLNANASEGHQWSLPSLWRHLEAQGVNTKPIIKKIEDIVIKTLIAVEKRVMEVDYLVPSRYTSYQLYGFDIGIDENLKPWLFEVNISPGMGIDSGFLLGLKGKLMTEYMNIAGYHFPQNLSTEGKKILREKLGDDVTVDEVTLDNRLYTALKTQTEIDKHETFTQKMKRTQYLTDILETLTPDDIRQLITAEDELTQCDGFHRIFPTSRTHTYLKYFNERHYYNILLDAWEEKYGNNRQAGIDRLKKLCQSKVHLIVGSNNS